ncbi:MAG: 50S ribosomal protein L27 [Candidatus Yonathbacteria bacterium]|nr:50S ribosomal protein L27 [Candidatus Yonathbacteria bacterium]NTW47890.1 50S ribosomal protein L27 [Candidatus Yonathbacteria bacterium]
MAHRKAGGTAKNLRDSNPKYLGTKLYEGQVAKTGMVIVRQRGTRIMPGENVGLGKDHTLFALANGTVKFGTKRKTGFNGKTTVKKVAHVRPTEVVTKKEKVSKKAEK